MSLLNQIAENCDIIFVTTPATLDNWILADIGNVIKSRKEKKDKKIERSKKSVKKYSRTVTE